jgi:hypothetical protein
MKPSIKQLIQNDTLAHRCYQEAAARRLDYTQLLELMVESLAKWKTDSIAQEMEREAKRPSYLYAIVPEVKTTKP